MLALFLVSSLQKIFPDTLNLHLENQGECFLDEIHNFQLVLRSDTDEEVELITKTDLTVRLYSQGFVKGTPAPEKNDGYYIHEKTVFPDPLFPVTGKIRLEKGKAVAIWVVCRDLTAGKHKIIFTAKEKSVEYALSVFDCKIAVSPVPVTNWIHVDCICDKHGVEPFTNDFYAVFDKYIELYILGGNSMILTPVFTPPLDTKVGTYRRTCQLVGVKKEKGKYRFDFKKLKFFMDFCRARGIEYFEFSHLLSQWGGTFCPKIEDEDGKLLFGWNDKSGGKQYKRFLRYYLRALVSFLRQSGYEKACYLHLSDEPNGKFVGQYIRKSKFVYKYVEKIKTVDAVNAPKLCNIPSLDVPAIATFDYYKMNELPENYFLYYSGWGCWQRHTNRFLHLPLQRVRVLGYQLFLIGASGFLHWGFNFYHSQFSVRQINPYEETDAGGAFPSGDSFIVYPSEKGATPSLRLFTMREALQDFYALKRVERLYGKEFTLGLLKESGMDGLSVYKGDIDWHIDLRKKINEYILKKQ